jgi:succinate dehydrogenase hydrophobic anchor subunit
MYTLLPVALPLILWILSRLFLPAGPYEMDHGNGTKPGTFFPLLILYRAFGYILVGLNVYGADWSYKHTCNLWVCGVFLAAALYSLLFAVLPLFFYEGYLHGKYLGQDASPARGVYEKIGPSNYTLGKYALTLSLGYSSVALLVYGVVMTALEVGR